MKVKKVSVGQIYKVEKEFFTSGKQGTRGETGRTVKSLISKDEFIEIRYPFDWHFRTVSNEYFHVEEEELLNNCSFFAKIDESVRFSNTKELKEILDKNLFTGYWVSNEE